MKRSLARSEMEETANRNIPSNVIVEVFEPPALDSPKHILNILNNDCVQEILRQLKSIRDYLNAAEICTRFQENTIECFPFGFRSIRINDADEGPQTLPLERVSSFLSIFGHLVHSLRWEFTFDRNQDDKILNMISKYCGKNLLELIIYGHDLNFDTNTKFSALEKLELYDSTISNFASLSQLKSLKFAFIKIKQCDWLAQEFPQLEEAKFNAFHKLRDDMLLEFLRLNPQLQSLQLHCCRHITPNVFMDIGNHTPNLVNLCIDPRKGQQKTFDESVIHLSALRRLKCLRIECPKFSGRALIDALAENNVPIEDLTVLNNRFDHNNQVLRDLSQSVSKLKTLKKLTLSFIFDEMLLNIVQQLPHIEEIHIVNSSDVTPQAIRETLKVAKLKVLSIRFHEFSMDFDDYTSILAQANGHVHIEIFYEDGIIDVADDLLKANATWIRIEKY